MALTYHWGISSHSAGQHLAILVECPAVNTLRPRQNERQSAEDIFKCIFLNENVCISIKISLKFVPRDSISNIPALVQIMAWRRSGDKLLSELMLVILQTHISVARPQWVNELTHWFLALILEVKYSNSLYRLVAWAVTVKLLSGECHRTLHATEHH